ncbi:MAG: SapC family protein [Beijerinckiaceae bacterium]
MPNIIELNPTRFGSKRWKRFTSYSFASGDVLAPVVLHELSRIVPQFAIAFLTTPEGPLPVALLGLKSGDNVFVAPEGRWVGRYIPAIFRCYPFSLLPAANGKRVVCIDTDSGLLCDDHEQGELLFTAEGTPSPELQQVLGFLQAYETNRASTRVAADALQRFSLFEPLPTETAAGSDEAGATPVLLRIREAALAALSPDELAQLRDSNGLALAYAQMFSMANIEMLEEMTRARQHARQKQAAIPPVNARGELDLEFLNTSGTLDFSKLG